MTQWNNSNETTIIDYRKGGAGNSWKVLDLQGEMTAPSGGGVSVDSKWGRGSSGERVYVGASVTSNPERFTFDVMWRLEVANHLKALTLQNCPFDVRARYRCGDVRDITNFESTLEYYDAYNTSMSNNEAIVNNADQPGSDIMDSFSMSAGLHGRKIKLQFADISKTVTDVAINKVIKYGNAQCAGECGDEQTGAEKIAFVTDLDAAPGYAGTSAPYVGITTDGGANWTLTYIDDFLTANATDIIKVGSRFIVFSPDHAPSYVAIQDLEDNLGATSFNKSTGITANFPSYGVATPGGEIWAFGDGGYIYKSTDGGFSFSSFDAGTITSSNLLAGAAATDDLIWIAGASGALVKINRGVGSLVSVIDTDSNVLSANINAVAVPEFRTSELYIGTAGGEVWRTKKALATNVEFTVMAFEQSGNGSIDALHFAGYRGDVLYLIQTNASNQSRVLLDYSGGALGQDAVVIGGFLSPANQSYNSIAPIDQNTAFVVGEVDGSQGFIGKISQ